MALRVSYDHAGLDPAVVQTLDSIIAQVQTWANSGGQADQVVGRDLTVGRTITALGQTCLRASGPSQNVPTGAETALTFTVPQTNKTFSDFFVGNGVTLGNAAQASTFDTFYLTKPGVYLVTARTRFDNDTTGIFRILQLRVGGDDTEWVTHVTPSSSSPSATVVALIYVDATSLLAAIADTSAGLPVKVEVLHDKGSDITLGGKLQVMKVA